MEQVPPAAATKSTSGASQPPVEPVQRFSTQDRKRAEATKRYLEDKYTKMKIQEKERRDRYLSYSKNKHWFSLSISIFPLVL